MRTEPRASRWETFSSLDVLRGVSVLGALGVVLFSMLAKPVTAGPIDPTPYRLAAADKERFDGGVEFGYPPTVAIEQRAAESFSAAAYDPVRMKAQAVASYLETISVPATFRATQPIRDRGVWIVRYTGLEQVTSRPLGAQPRTLTTLFVFLDAANGQLLFAEWFE